MIKKKKLIKISVATFDNGYELAIGSNKYFYYSAETLMMGIAYHAVDDCGAPAEMETLANLMTSHTAMFETFRRDYNKFLDQKEELQMQLKEANGTIHEMKAIARKKGFKIFEEKPGAKKMNNIED